MAGRTSASAGAQEGWTPLMVTHYIARWEVECRYETVNLCTFRGGQLASRFSRPEGRRDYAVAWGIALAAERQPT